MEGLFPPLGELVDVVTAAPTSGVPGSERVVVAKLPGCERVQAFWLTRFALGSAVAGRQINDWLSKQPALKRSLFGKADVLNQAGQRSRRTSPRPSACAGSTGWRLAADDVGDRECAGAISTLPADHLFEDKGRVAAVVRLTPADEGAKDRCRPKLSALLADDKGVARLAVHADFGGAMSVEVFGNNCDVLAFEFDTASRSFLPKRSKRPSCPGKPR